MKKILVIGRNGQISGNLVELLKAQNEFQFRALGHNELDLSKPEKVFSELEKLGYNPDIIINSAAYTAVDSAEDERDICNKINNLAVAEIARFCLKTEALLVHYSTDYVFDGSGIEAFTETNTANLAPLNYYGVTKLAGENAIIQSGCDYIILRTSWVYNHSGKNFVATILKLAAEKDEIKIVDDQIGSPTYARDIAEATLEIIKNPMSGIYHLVPNKQISWYEFARLIIGKENKPKIIPIKTSEYLTKAKRPLNSRLSSRKLEANYAIALPPIRESLDSCLKRMKFSVGHN